jgi:N-acylneuraminate cytidylyltransferase
MSPVPSILGLVPARAGSKRLPGKNFRDLCGSPLVAWTLDAAITSGQLADVVVSTDDPRVEQIARAKSVECLFRPPELATDQASSVDVLIHALDQLRLQGRFYDAIMLLQATSPLRGAKEIQEAAALYRKHPDCSVVSMCPSEYRPQWMAEPDASGMIRNFSPAVPCSVPAPLRLNGAIYIVPCKHLRETGGMYTERTVPYVMPRSLSLDIDTEEDFFLCECLMARRRGSPAANADTTAT